MATSAMQRYEKKLYSGGDLGLPFLQGCAYLRTPVAYSLRLHEHDGYEITYLLSGQTDWWLVGGQSLPLVGGSVALIQPGVPHQGLFHSIEPCELLWMVFRPPARGTRRSAFLSPALMKAMAEGLERAGNIVRPGTPRMRSLASAFRDPPAAHRGQPGLRQAWLRAVLVQFLLESYQALTTARESGAGDPAIPDVRRVCALYVEEHLADPISIGQLAGLFGLSQSRFFDVFRHQTGMTPSDFVSRLRIRHAQRELITSRRSVTDTALRCGFSTSQYFARRFKEYVGITPSEFRGRFVAASDRGEP
jgi:AraC-like DNA-binding protein